MGRAISDELEIVRCAILYSKGWTKEDIARELDISSLKVTQNIKTATKEGIIKLESQFEVAEKIRNDYKLRDVYVFPLGTSKDISKLAAAYLEKRLDDEREGFLLFTVGSEFKSDLSKGTISQSFRRELERNDFSLSENVSVSPGETEKKWLINNGGKTYVVREEDKKLWFYRRIERVAIGPGRIMLDFVRAMPDKERPAMNVGSTASAALVETYVASNVLIEVLAAKWECDLYRLNFPMRPEQLLDYADIFFFGVEKIPDIDDATARVILAETDIPRSTLSQDLATLFATEGGNSFINHQPVNAKGEPLDWDREYYKEIFTSEEVLLKLDAIQKMAADREKRAVCIAYGADKVAAIRAGLRGGYFSALITDYDTATRI